MSKHRPVAQLLLEAGPATFDTREISMYVDLALGGLGLAPVDAVEEEPFLLRITTPEMKIILEPGQSIDGTILRIEIEPRVGCDDIAGEAWLAAVAGSLISNLSATHIKWMDRGDYIPCEEFLPVLEQGSGSAAAAAEIATNASELVAGACVECGALEEADEPETIEIPPLAALLDRGADLATHMQKEDEALEMTEEKIEAETVEQTQASEIAIHPVRPRRPRRPRAVHTARPDYGPPMRTCEVEAGANVRTGTEDARGPVATTDGCAGPLRSRGSDEEIEHRIRQALMTPPKRSEIEALREESGIPTRTEQFSAWALTASAATLALPLALPILAHQVVRGADLRLASLATGLAGLFLALDSTGATASVAQQVLGVMP